MLRTVTRAAASTCTAALATLALALALAACGDADPKTVSVPAATGSALTGITATPTATPPPTTPTATPPPATPSPSASASTAASPSVTATPPRPTPVAGVPGHPPELLLGSAPLDLAVSAVLSADPAQVRASLVFSQVRCVNAREGPTAPPNCPAGAAEGTPVFVFLTGKCEREIVLPFETAADIAAVARPGQRLYAAWAEQTPTGPATALLFAGPPLTPGGKLTATTVSVNQYGIQAFNLGCGADPQTRLATVKPASFVLPPPN